MSVGAVELVVAHVAWPPGAHERLGVPPPVPLDGLRPEVEDAVRQELDAWLADAKLTPRPTVLVKAGFGRVDSHLCRIAADQRADLVVVATHQRAGVARLWQGSVSRGVLHGAAMSVACVPRTAPPEGTPRAARPADT
jgi:nucleotide-binding universal stress UspA family protein